MEDYPKSLIDFESRFKTDEECRKYLENIRWPEGFRCPRCASTSSWTKANGLHICRQCSLQTSVITGTIFQDTKKPLNVWFLAMGHITSQKYGANALGIQRILGLGSYRTAWAWLHKLRRAMVRPGRDKLSGVVHVDETFIGGTTSGKRGRGADGKSLVLVVAQEDGQKVGRIRLSVISDASAATLTTMLALLVEPGTLIKTDGWPGYNDLETSGFHHQILRQEATIGEDLLPHCHRVASLLKRWLLGTHQGAVRSENLQYYLDEFTFRFNRRTSSSRGKLFFRLVQQAVLLDPVPLTSLKSTKKSQTTIGSV